MRKVLLNSLVLVLALVSLSFTKPRLAAIEFVEVPGPGSGPDSRGDISGRILNLNDPEHYKVVLYAHTDLWYVEPLTEAPYTDILVDGSWSNWTHLGHRYAAMVVRPTYNPPLKTQSLPKTGPDVLVVAEVKAKSSHTN